MLCKIDKNVVLGQPPMKISRITKFALECGINLTATWTATPYRKSPLVQGVVNWSPMQLGGEDAWYKLLEMF